MQKRLLFSYIYIYIRIYIYTYICFLQFELLGKEAQSPGYEELLPAKYAFVLHTKMLGLYGDLGVCCPAHSDFSAFHQPSEGVQQIVRNPFTQDANEVYGEAL